MRVEGELLLGREGEGPGYLGESAEISRRHARLVRTADGGLMIDDLGSLNGTLVNGERIERARRLAVGDTVKVGDALLVVLDAHGRAGQPTAYAREREDVRPPAAERAADTADLPAAGRSSWLELGDLQ